LGRVLELIAGQGQASHGSAECNRPRFVTALTLKNIAYCFVGTFVGTVIGVLPGLGPVATISLLLPFSFTMDVTSSVILMAGIFYGAQYGGSITAILVRIPGEASAVVTCLDGYAHGAPGPRRGCARHRRLRLVHRRRGCHHRVVRGRPCHIGGGARSSARQNIPHSSCLACCW
jgi:hypothetical protein